jgi:predicted ATPase/class 3 adenylate cyclase
MDIADWLRSLGLEQYEPAFRDNAIDGAVLPQLTPDDLKDVGVSQVGHRRKLLNAIAALGDPGPAATPAIDSISPTVTAAPSGGERRQLTVMFCDLVGFTALSSRLDPEDLSAVIRSYQSCVATTVARFGGFIARYVGDGVLIYFGWPEAHETDAERAVRAALAVIDANGQTFTRTESLQVRVGIATGLVVVGEPIGAGEARQQTAIGETPNLAARLQGLAGPDSVVIDAATRRQIGGLFGCRDLGFVELKGLPEPMSAWQVVEEAVIESRFEALHAGAMTPLIGRDEEFELLLRRWRQAKQGEGQVMLLSGEPGLGKSRLIAALRERLREEPHARLQYFCAPHHRDSALYPFIAQLERVAGFVREDPTAAKLDKLEVLLAQAGETTVETMALFADMLTLPTEGRYPPLPYDPPRQRELTLAALLGQLEGFARQGPVLLLFEDAHWADSTSLELLNRTIERLASLPVLMVVTFRPELAQAWVGQARVTLLALNRLGRQEAALLVSSIAGGKSLPGEILSHIVEHTDGIPLFIEELTKSVLEAGLLREVDNSYVLAGPLPPLAIPSSLQASLMARLDRLAPVRDVAQIGAAIGREFSFELLAAVAGRSVPQLTDALDQLVAAGLVFRRGTPPRATFIFKHALVQEAAYETLLKSRRQQLHGHIAKALAEHLPSVAQTQPEVMAHHYTEARDLENAIESWLRAGQLATARSAYVEAIAHLHKGLELANSSKDQESREINLQLALGATLIAIKGYASVEAEAAFLRARDLLQGSGDVARLEESLHGLQMVTYNRAEFNKTLGFSKKQLMLVERQSESSSLCAAHKNMASALHSLGLFEEGFRHAERAVRLIGTGRTEASRYAHDVGIAATSYYAILAWHRGLFGASADSAKSVLIAAEKSMHTNTDAYARHYAGAFRAAVLADMRMLEIWAKSLVVFAKENKLQQWIAWGTCYHGLLLVHGGAAIEAVDEVREGIGRCEQLGNKAFRPFFLSFLAAAQAASGRIGEAILTLEEAIAIGEATAERWYTAELWRNKADLYQISGRQNGAAEECLLRALHVARQQGSRCFELRAASRLAILLRDRGGGREARDLLAPIYGWFTEGFDTKDLLEAKALLDELA